MMLMKYKISVQITCSFSELKLIFIPFAYQHKAWYDHGDSTEKVQRQKHFVNQTETLDLKTYLTFISIYFQLHVAVNDVNWVDHAGMRVPSIALQLPNVRYKPGNKRRTQQQIISSQILKHKTITVPQQASFMIRPIYYYILFVEFLIF